MELEIWEGRDGTRWGPGPPQGPIFFLVILYFIFIVESPFSSISLAILTQIATIQPKNLTKKIKIFTMVIEF